MNIKTLPIANEDLVNGYQFYEKQSQGLGSYFLDSLFPDIEFLLIYYGIHQQFFGNYYRLLSKRFPFAVYYVVEKQDIIVYAVLDYRRSPAWLAGRLEKE
jgi:hypothetical protein